MVGGPLIWAIENERVVPADTNDRKNPLIKNIEEPSNEGTTDVLMLGKLEEIASEEEVGVYPVKVS